MPTPSKPSLPALHDETHLKVLRLLQANPELSQRELALALGVSVGKMNYCVHALLGKGFLKAKNFRNHRNKRAYAYLLTPEGLAAKAALTARFLKRKMLEYDLLRSEIEQLKGDLALAEQTGDRS
jgi:EPS-associated MarR family transcriptional regulator